MGISGYDLSHYPLDEHYRACQQYMHSAMDWDKISASIIQANGTVGVDVSDAISLFPHLELDSEYRLICYMTSEYHGIFGEVAAVKQSDDWRPKFDSNKKFHPHLTFNELQMPECTVPAMEAIFHDGTAEGYFEAVLCTLFLEALPDVRFEQDHWYVIMYAPPSDYEKKWEHYVALADWKPRHSGDTIIALKRKPENGLGSSDGKDLIFLTQYAFHSSINHAWVASFLRTKHPDTSNHITSTNRYSDTKKCCLFSHSSVLIAREK